MASGDSLLQFNADNNKPTQSSGAFLESRVDASSPPQVFNVYAFNAANDSYIDLILVMPQHYGGGGITLRLNVGAKTATTGNLGFDAALRRIEDGVDDIDSSHTYDYNSVTSATPGTAGIFKWVTITFTNGTDMDSVAAGDVFNLRIKFNTANGTIAGNAHLLAGEIQES